MIKLIIHIFIFITLPIQVFSLDKITLDELLSSSEDIDIYIDGTEAIFEGSIFDIIGDGFYYGKCIRVHVVNSTESEFTLIIPPGIYLVSDDSTIQNMLTTKTEELLISPYDSVVFPIHAMCAEIDKTSPTDDYYYTIGELDNDNLLKLALFLDEKNIQDDAGQLSVWAVSNDAPRYKLNMYVDNKGSLDKSYAILKKLNIETRFTKQYEQRGKTARIIAYVLIGFLILTFIVLSLLYFFVWKKKKINIE